MRSFVRRATVWVAVLYPIALIAVALVLRCVGERWWLAGIALYVPRVVLGLPLVALVPGLWTQRLRRLLWLQLVAGCVWLFPLLGLVLPRWHAKAKGPSIRVLSYNVNSCKGGYSAVADSVLRSVPDVVVLQELFDDPRPLVALLQAKYPTIDVSEQFLMASRFPLRAKTTPPAATHLGYLNVPHVVRYELDTPVGPIALITLHPVSPHPALRVLRRALFGSGTKLDLTRTERLIRENSDTREFELNAAVDLARSERLPVVIAGDTNVPNSSPLLGVFSGYQDGFESAGWGLGYTFPSRFAWLRLDRVLASRELDFVGFGVDCGLSSDHRCVTADIARRGD